MPSETTPLSPGEERLFRAWAKAQGVRDLDHPASRYDYRGYWKHVVSKGEKGTQIDPKDGQRHFPDTFKQHGHPLFSAESQYSRGKSDGGQWLPGDVIVGPDPPAQACLPAPSARMPLAATPHQSAPCHLRLPRTMLTRSGANAS